VCGRDKGSKEVRTQTEKMRQEWVDRYLNGGVCPNTHLEWKRLLQSDKQIACYSGLEWLATTKPDIITLEDAWDRCPRPDWLLWAYARLQPSKKDAIRALSVGAELVKWAKYQLVPGVDIRDNCIVQGIWYSSVLELKAVDHTLELKRYLLKNGDQDAADVVGSVADELRSLVNTLKAVRYREIQVSDYATIVRELVPNPWRNTWRNKCALKPM